VKKNSVRHSKQIAAGKSVHQKVCGMEQQVNGLAHVQDINDEHSVKMEASSWFPTDRESQATMACIE